MKRQLVVATWALALLVLASSPTLAAKGTVIDATSDGEIGMFFDTDLALCQKTIPCNTSATLYVYALIGVSGASRFGITGAEYRVGEGPTSTTYAGCPGVNPNNAVDPCYFYNEHFDPTATIVGSGAFTPTDDGTNNPRGINISWATCQVGDGSKILIETVDIFNCNCDPNLPELRLDVIRHSTPSNPFFQCPLFTLCDDPVFTKVCLGHNKTTCKNPFGPPCPNNAQCSSSGSAFINGSRDCRVGVEEKNWSQVKQLFR